MHLHICFRQTIIFVVGVTIGKSITPTIQNQTHKARKLIVLDLANMLISGFNLNNSINFEDNINIDILDNLSSDDDMTTVIAIKCNDGIIIASDSQATAGDTKDLMASKIFQVNKNIGIGCAGMVGHIDSLVDKMKEKLNDELIPDVYMRKNIIDGLLELHKQYNVEYAKKAGYETAIHNFNAYGIVGTKLECNNFSLYLLLPSSKNLAIPTVLPLHDYRSIGTGSRFANFMFKTQFRVLSTISQKPISSLPMDFLIWIVTYIINEIKETDVYSGGHTNISIINKYGWRNIPKETILKHYDDGIQMI